MSTSTKTLGKRTVAGRMKGAASRMRIFANATLLSAGLALASVGCGDTIHYHYYNQPQETPETPEAPEVPEPVPCVDTVVETLSCEQPRIIVDLEEGKHIRLSSDDSPYAFITFEKSEDGEDSRELVYLDGNCVRTSSETLQVGGSVTGDPGFEAGEPAHITLVDADNDSAEVEVALPLIASGDLNQGEELVFTAVTPAPEFRARLDDLSVYPANEPPSALVSLVADGITIQHLDINEGTAEPVVEDQMSIGAPTVSPGVSFGAMRATIEVFYCGGPF